MGIRAPKEPLSKEVNTALGRDKEPRADDPMELKLTCVPGGDPEIMATCLMEEYARLGMGEEEILRLFRQPVYQTHALYRESGEARVRGLLRRVLSRTGRLRVSVRELHQIGGDDA